MVALNNSQMNFSDNELILPCDMVCEAHKICGLNGDTDIPVTILSIKYVDKIAGELTLHVSVPATIGIHLGGIMVTESVKAILATRK